MICMYNYTVYSRARLCGVSAIRKKMPYKMYVGASNGAHKIVPKAKYLFLK